MESVTLVAFLAGLVLGALGCFLIMNKAKTQSNIEQQLRELQEEFTAYRENVNTHFNSTAEMVNTLTQNYLAVQKHLETAADSFAEPPKSFKLDTPNKLPRKKTEFISLEAKPKESLPEEADAEFNAEDTVQAPRDYAPKSNTADKGTLSEDYGLHDSQAKTTP
ncbi:MAG: DUF1043 family protein [Ketobacter sp.]|nr:MAG: DUF1043 family protein [Ketobacter sp.]